jgi:orotidine 5''-phosphate decarboxylase, subfamily 2
MADGKSSKKTAIFAVNGYLNRIMTYNQLFENIKSCGSFLCVGLDTDPELIPVHFLAETNRLLLFNMEIIDATAPYCVAYKLNTAFYEAEGTVGIDQMLMTVRYIRKKYPEKLIIADAKRGDIGNTAERYAKAYFDTFDFDAITLNPYMGSDSVRPFLDHDGKWSIILALTSNKSSEEFETFGEAPNMPNAFNESLYGTVIEKAKFWGSRDNTMFVVGATKADSLKKIRKYCPDHFLLVPGVGAQGGSLEEVANAGLNSHCGLLVNSSRGIIYASRDEKFASAAGKAAAEMAKQMKILMKRI